MDADLRGRTELEIGSLLRSGIQKVAPDKKVICFSNEPEAIDHVVHTAEPGSFTTIFADNVQSVCSRLTHHLQEYRQMHQPIKRAI